MLISLSYIVHTQNFNKNEFHSIVLNFVKNSVPRVSTGESRRNKKEKLVPSPATIVSVLTGRRQAVNS